MSVILNCEPETGRLWTEAEFLALPESKYRTELLDGEYIHEPSADFAHEARASAIWKRLADWGHSRSPCPDVCRAALDVRFAPGRILQPDVFVYLSPLPRPVRMPIETVPDLCIEVVSRDRVYDRVTKRQVYAEAGVREYWTVVAQLGFVERWTGSGLVTREEFRDVLVTPLLPGFKLDVLELMREP